MYRPWRPQFLKPPRPDRQRLGLSGISVCPELPAISAALAVGTQGFSAVTEWKSQMILVGLEPTIPGSVGRCLIHWATRTTWHGPASITSASRATSQWSETDKTQAGWFRHYKWSKEKVILFDGKNILNHPALVLAMYRPWRPQFFKPPAQTGNVWGCQESLCAQNFQPFRQLWLWEHRASLQSQNERVKWSW